MSDIDFERGIVVHPCMAIVGEPDAPRPCEHIVSYDDEPFCFTHSDDEGSSVRGYSWLDTFGVVDEWRERHAAYVRQLQRGVITQAEFVHGVHVMIVKSLTEKAANS